MIFKWSIIFREEQWIIFQFFSGFLKKIPIWMKGKKTPRYDCILCFPTRLYLINDAILQIFKLICGQKCFWKYLLHIPWQLDEKYLKKSQCLSIKPQPQFQGIHGIQPRPQPCNHKKRKKIKTLNVFVVHFQSRVILEWDHFSG